jgi:hypothetical protein
LLVRLISLWFALQVLLNIAITLYLTMHPPDRTASRFENMDLIGNTAINAVLAVGVWQVRSWAWHTAMVLLPLYWTLHVQHMLVPEEGLLLWPFLMVDALILDFLLSVMGRRVFNAPTDRWKRLSLLPVLMFALGLYAMSAPVLGMFVAIAGALAVVAVGWRRTVHSPESVIHD